MIYEIVVYESGYVIVGPHGALLRDGGAGYQGEPSVWKQRSHAAAKTEWLNRATVMMSGGERRRLRAEIAAKHGIVADVAKGLLN